MGLERIAFILPNVSGGGAARVATILCSEWARSGHAVSLVTFENPESEPAYPLDPQVERHKIGLSASPQTLLGIASNNANRVFRLRRILKKIHPTAVISFLLEANVPAALAARSLGLPVLISERNHPGFDTISDLKARIRANTYPLANRLCVQTGDIGHWFKTKLGIDARVIPNPAPSAGLLSSGKERLCENTSRKRVISLGRLEPQKGFDRLIEAFALIAGEVPDWDIVIYGEGAQRAALQRKIQEHHLDTRMKLPGVTRAPAEELGSSDLYVHTARYEGFPNAVLEALSAGLCVIATDCPGGTREILKNGSFGLLVPEGDVHALAASMLRLIRDKALRASFESSSHYAVRPFSPQSIAQRWIDEIAACRREC